MKRLELLNNLRKKKRMREEFEVQNALITASIAQLLEDKWNSTVRIRTAALYRKRWDCVYLRDLAEKENSFVSEYRLGPKQFDMLCDMLSPIIDKNQEMAQRAMAKCKSAPISTDSRVGAALIMLAGGRATESMRTHGLAKATVYCNLHEVVRAINTHPSLEIKYDSSLVGLRKRAKEFRSRGQFGLFRYMTDAADGLLIRIEAPTRMKKNDPILNKIQYYSGSKKSFGVNMQGVCDANIKFTAVSCKHVGSTNDSIAFETSNLKDINSKLPFPFHWCGDPAYTLTDTMIIPFEGINIHISFPTKESFNFYHSQLRITIERCFGVFIARWGIFWKDLKYDLEFVMEIVHACCRLHNFCIDSKLPIITENYNVTYNARLDESGRLVDDEWRNIDPEDTSNPVLATAEEIEDIRRTGSVVRDSILDEITRNGYAGVRSHHR